MKRKWLAIGIILIFIGTCIVPAIAQNTEKQSSRGNWLYVGGNGPGNYTSIQAAIDNASNGDTIIVYSGTYNEAVTLDKQLFLKGIKSTNQEFPLINGGDDSDAVTIRNDSCSIENFSVQNGEAGGLKKGINVLSNYNSIRNCTIFNTGSGIYLSYSCGNSIFDNEITGWGSRSIGLISSCNNSIFNNDLSGHDNHEIWFRDNATHNRFYHNYVHQCTHNPAILIEESPFNIIEENNISGNYEGLVIRSSPNTSVLRNSFWGDGILFSASFQELCSYTIQENLVDGKPLRYYLNQTGITVPADTGQVVLINCSNFLIRNFTFIGAEHGIVLFLSSNNSITGNTISAGPAGIQLSHSHDNVISRNMIDGGRGGIILSTSNNNIISNNTIQNQNKQPGICASSSNNNKIIDNTVMNSRIGILAEYNAADNEITQNTVTDSSWGISLYASENNTVTRNKVSNCSNAGIKIDSSSGDSIENNLVDNCGTGIGLVYADFTEVTKNLISKNNIGIGISASSNCSIVRNNISNHIGMGIALSDSGFILVKENNLMGNIVDAVFSVRLLEVLTNKFKDNYWGILSLKPHIIIGTMKIHIFTNPMTQEKTYLSFPWLYVDWHPTKEPYDLSGIW